MIYSENILICIAIPLVVMLPFMKGHTRHNFVALLLGMVMCLLGAYLNSFFADILEYDDLATARYIAPIVEEIMKMIPILLFALLMDSKSKGTIEFAVGVGAGFATFENCIYITTNSAEMISFVLIRGLAVGIMHVLCGLLMGIAINLAIKYKTIMVPGTMGAFTFAMTIHALYNLLVSEPGVATYVGFCTPILILGFVYLGKNRIYE